MKQLALLLSIISFYSNGVTIVYNMRVAMVTRQQMNLFEDPRIAVGTAFRQWRAGLDDSNQTTLGTMGTYMHSHKMAYFKIDSAIGHVHNDLPRLQVSRTQLDDLLFTVGYGHVVNEKLRFAYSGLFGVPTHRDFILELAQFGTGHVGLGAQVDGGYDYSGDRSNLVFAAARLIHFFPRTIQVKTPCLQPLYQYNEYHFALGNIVDIYFSHQTNWNKRNRFECGYDATFGFGANIKPEILNFGGTARLIRHNFFGAYYRLIPFNQTPTAIVIGLSYGFDSKPKLIGNKLFVTMWGSWGIVF